MGNNIPHKDCLKTGCVYLFDRNVTLQVTPMLWKYASKLWICVQYSNYRLIACWGFFHFYHWRIYKGKFNLAYFSNEPWHIFLWTFFLNSVACVCSTWKYVAAQPVLVRFYLIIGKLSIFGQIYVGTSFFVLQYCFEWIHFSVETNFL